MENTPAVVLQRWQADCSFEGQSHILPDGCRDLIYKRQRGQRPKWFVTRVATLPDIVETTAGDQFTGYRLRAGVCVDGAGLLNAISQDMAEADVLDRVMHFSTQDPNVSEALACLESNQATTVALAAKTIGVQTRKLQRLLADETGHSPVFWLRLARVRRAAGEITTVTSLANLAYAQGYCDQAHMTREFQHWLGATPRRIKADTAWKSAHLGLGYGA